MRKAQAGESDKGVCAQGKWQTNDSDERNIVVKIGKSGSMTYRWERYCGIVRVHGEAMQGRFLVRTTSTWACEIGGRCYFAAQRFCQIGKLPGWNYLGAEGCE